MSISQQDVHECRILIVEDDRVGRMMLKAIFSAAGFSCIEEAVNGKEALEKVQTFRPDLMILDVVMPEMDGAECCRRIRQDVDPRIAHMPVLVQTALDKPADKARLFEAGATDYITKPVDPHEIIARSVVQLEREIMTRALREFNVRMAQELDTARMTQGVLIPDAKTLQEIAKDYGLHIHGHYQPSSELGGDFWGIKSLSNEELAIYMVDFSGHGVNAALNVFRLHALMQAAMDTAKSPGAYLARLNATLAPLLPTGQFCTMFYGVINTRMNALSYASAAAPQPLFFSKCSGEYGMLENTGGLLGMRKTSHFESREIPFAPGDCLLLYSDALIETENEKGGMFAPEDIAALFQTNPENRRFQSLLQHFGAQYAPRLRDDLTLVACTRAGA